MPKSQRKNIEVGKIIKEKDMKHLSKKSVYKSALILFVIFSGFNMLGQNVKVYDYAEVVVIQNGNTGAFESININSISSTSDKAKISSVVVKLKNTSALLKYMNSNNWEFVERKTVLWGSAIWVNFIFRKRTE